MQRNGFCHPPIVGKDSVHDFGPCRNIDAAGAIDSEMFGAASGSGSVVVAWEHATIPYLVKALIMAADGDCGGNANGMDLRDAVRRAQGSCLIRNYAWGPRPDLRWLGSVDDTSRSRNPNGRRRR